MCHTHRSHRVSESELNARIAENQRAAACAARQIIRRAAQRAQQAAQRPPCNQNCNQGDACPQWLKAQQQAQADAAALREQAAAEARAKVAADAEISGLPVGKWALIAYLGVIAGTVGLSHAFARGWL